MTDLFALLLPIVLSSVVVFFISAIINMAAPWHKTDYPRMPDEEKIMEALRPFNIPPGDYLLPRPANREDMRSPDFIEKMKKGPVIVMTVVPNGVISMGKNLTLWFLYSLLNGLFSAYIAGRALPIGADYLQVFRFISATAFIGYSVALWQMSIWYGRSWTATIKSTADGFIYACLTAGVFGWLWPR